MAIGSANQEATPPLSVAREPAGLGRRVAQALASLRSIEAEVSAGAEPALICHAVARTLGQLLLADLVIVSGVSAEGEAMLPVATVTLEPRPINPRLLDLEVASSQLAALAPGTLLHVMATGDDGAAGAISRHLRELGAGQALIVPLVRQSTLLGRVDIVRVEAAPLSQIELDLCVQATSPAATAVALARADAAASEADGAELMLRISEALRQAQPGSPSELLQVVTALAPPLLGCDRCYAYLWQSDRNQFLPAAVNGMSEEQVSALKQHPMVPAEVALFEQLLYSTRPLAIDDAFDSTLLLPDFARMLGTRALLALPLRGRRKDVLGALMLDYAEPGRAFTPAQVLRASRMAEQVAAMVENASLVEEVSQRSDRLAVLNEIGLDLAAVTELDAIFPALHGKLATVIDASALFCALQEPDRSALTVYHMAGPALTVMTDVDLSESPLLTQVFEEGQGTVLQAGAAQLLLGLTGDQRPAAQSLVCVPLRHRGQQVMGALGVYSVFAHAYTAHDLELLSTVASQITVAVENARLYTQVQAKGELRGQLLDRIMSAHELERKSIVDDIHDDSLQAMVSSMYKIDLCLRLGETQNHQRELEELRNVRANLADNVDRLRTLIFEIRPSTLDYLGLLPTLDDYLARLATTTGIAPTFRSELGARLDRGLETLIYRLLQELLSNVRKHSRARSVVIELKRVPDGVRVIVEDDGVGFDPDSVMGESLSGEGIGLAAVRERVQVAGGSFQLESQLGHGARVVIVLPMTAGQHITGPLGESRLPRESLSG